MRFHHYISLNILAFISFVLTTVFLVIAVLGLTNKIDAESPFVYYTVYNIVEIMFANGLFLNLLFIPEFIYKKKHPNSIPEISFKSKFLKIMHIIFFYLGWFIGTSYFILATKYFSKFYRLIVPYID